MVDCFVHASDLHLDAPLGSLGLLDSERRGQLADLATKAWDNLVGLCLEEGASFLVLSGDIFDNAVAGVGVQLDFHKGLRRLADNSVRVFICHGNHDPLSGDFETVGELPEGAVRFAPGTPQSYPVTLRNSGDSVLVSGVSFGTQHETENLARRFRGLSPQSGAVSGPHVAVLHANVGGNPGHDPYAPCSYEDLGGAGVDYWALGHIHRRDVRRLEDGGWAAYCGNLQGRSFKPAECEPKGALVVPVEQGRIGEPRFEPCDKVRFVREEIAVKPGDSILDVQDRLLEAATKLGGDHAPKPVVWEVRLTGTNEEARRMRQAVDNDELQSHVSDELSRRLRGGGLCRLEAPVRTAVKREAILLGGDLRADVLRELQRLSKSAANPSADGTPTDNMGADGSRDAGVSDDDRLDDGIEPALATVTMATARKQGHPDSSAGSSAAPDIHELLGRGLPAALSDFWRDLIDLRPERLGDVLALAEELLLEIFAEADTEQS